MIKSFFTPLTEPLGAIWLVMVLALAWLLCRRQWRSGAWLGVPTVLLFLVGSTPLSEALVANAERPYASAALNNQKSTGDVQHDAIVVLGGGYYPSQYDYSGFALGGGASRLVTGFELARQGRAPCLVLGGSLPSSGDACVTCAKVQQWAKSLCPANLSITNLGICSNTHDEAMAFKRLKEANHWRSILLVTSALHMRRSAALFRSREFTVAPVACDFRVCGASRSEFHRLSPFPCKERFEVLSAYIHEKIGWWVYRARGWI